MTRVLLLTVFAALLSACGSSSGGGGAGGSNSGFDGASEDPNNPGLGEANIVCAFREPVTQVYYRGFGDTTATATEVAAEVCRNFAPANGNCAVTPVCETRRAEGAWTCTVVNTVTGDRWTDSGRSRLETFGFMHGICSAGHHASPQVCTALEQSTCVQNF